MKRKVAFRKVGRNSKETAEFIEKFYTEILDRRGSLDFEELIIIANSKPLFRRWQRKKTNIFWEEGDFNPRLEVKK